MIRKVFVALSVTVFDVAVTISILAHCGDTWVTQAPTFGPQLTRSNCTDGGTTTTTTKSVETTIHWTVGPERTVVITDQGENKIIPGIISDDCVRCFPVFESPEWIDLGTVLPNGTRKRINKLSWIITTSALRP